jgi:hypothetical protein
MLKMLGRVCDRTPAARRLRDPAELRIDRMLLQPFRSPQAPAALREKESG